ncbi:MAG: aminofutalosine synthase MqnE [Verrucomicrobiae bacterium]|nr:aminofutalosine synthase MqnE [Verrucomicrobiae bacterium]
MSRLSDAEALRLFQSHDLAAIGQEADRIRRQKHGDAAYYILNRHINYSNLCVLDCDFCAFYRRPGADDAFELTLEQITEKAREAIAIGITEIHLVGGLHPTWKLDRYVEMLRALQAVDSRLHLKAFTSVEIRHIARLSRCSVAEVLTALREAGLGSLTGGGAEIFAAEIRRQICAPKETAEQWLEVHRTWHRMGGRSTCTMLIGHLESFQHRVDHLQRLRQLQDETGGFTAFVLLPFRPSNTRLSHLSGPSGYDILKTLAIARIYFDNIEHIKAYWIALGVKLAQVALSFGVDDLDGTVLEEKIFHMAGATTPQRMLREELERMIREAGFRPVQRDSLYRIVRS